MKSDYGAKPPDAVRDLQEQIKQDDDYVSSVIAADENWDKPPQTPKSPTSDTSDLVDKEEWILFQVD